MIISVTLFNNKIFQSPIVQKKKYQGKEILAFGFNNFIFFAINEKI
jgi:hypothetical protein